MRCTFLSGTCELRNAVATRVATLRARAEDASVACVARGALPGAEAAGNQDGGVSFTCRASTRVERMFEIYS